jgi:NADH-quinone oxidoreductase subunit K
MIKFLDYISVYEFLKVFLTVFFMGVWGVFLIRRNLLIILISLEIILFAINLNFIVFSLYLDDYLGQIFALLVLTVAASESALGLAILVIYYRLRGLIDLNSITLLKG